MQKGFIALITMIILSFVLLIIVISVGSRGVASRLLLLDLEHKDASESLAQACIEIAAVKVVNDPTFSITNKWVSVGNNGCKIHSVVPDAPNSRSSIFSTASSSKSFTNLKVILNHNGTIYRWEELPVLP